MLLHLLLRGIVRPRFRGRGSRGGQLLGKGASVLGSDGINRILNLTGSDIGIIKRHHRCEMRQEICRQSIDSCPVLCSYLVRHRSDGPVPRLSNTPLFHTTSYVQEPGNRRITFGHTKPETATSRSAAHKET